MTKPRKKTNPKLSHTRDLIFHIYQNFREEAVRFSHLDNGYFNNPEERVSNATGIPRSFLTNLLKEKGLTPQTSLSDTGQMEQRNKLNELLISNEDFNIIRQKVHNHLLKLKTFFTMTALKTELETFGYRGSRECLKKILSRMGFQILKIENNKRILAEKSELRAQRIKFIKQIEQARSEGKNIIYLGQTNLEVFTPTGNTTCKELETLNISVKSNRLMMVHAGHINGLLPGALMVHDCTKTIKTNFETWVLSQLIPSLPTNSLVIIENMKLYNNTSDKSLHAFSKRQSMIFWLINHKIPVDPNLTKPELYDIIQKQKANMNSYSLDQTLEEYGHSVLRFPVYHTDLNPMEQVWDIVKKYVEKHVVNETSVEKLVKVVTDCVSDLGQDQWRKAWEDVMDVEKRYMSFDRAYDKYTDKFIITGDSEGEEDSCGSALEDDFDSD